MERAELSECSYRYYPCVPDKVRSGWVALVFVVGGVAFGTTGKQKRIYNFSVKSPRLWPFTWQFCTFTGAFLKQGRWVK